MLSIALNRYRAIGSINSFLKYVLRRDNSEIIFHQKHKKMSQYFAAKHKIVYAIKLELLCLKS